MNKKKDEYIETLPTFGEEPYYVAQAVKIKLSSIEDGEHLVITRTGNLFIIQPSFMAERYNELLEREKHDKSEDVEAEKNSYEHRVFGKPELGTIKILVYPRKIE